MTLKLASITTPEVMKPVGQRYGNTNRTIVNNKDSNVDPTVDTKIRSDTTIKTKTEHVNPGEVCSIDMAKKYGFYDSENYYSDDYSDTKTFNSSTDTPSRSYKLCKEVNVNNKKVAYPMCTLLYGLNKDGTQINAPYVQDQIDANKCVINDCPPGFIKSSNKCIKPDTSKNTMKPVSKKTHCDEQKSDWYMFPNYHLGNKYSLISNENKETVCMKPCSMNKVPGYVEDPVDGSSAGVLTNTILTQCYEKNEYMGGKYNNTGNFCPLAWIYRLGQNKENIIEDLTKEIIQKEKENGTNNSLKRAILIANEDANKIYTDSKMSLENVTKSSSEMLAACRKLYTKDRITNAYKICQDIKTNPNRLNELLKDKTQQTVLIQACDTQFCNDLDDDALTMMGPSTKALCFDNTNQKLQSKDIMNNDRNIEIQQSNDIKNDPPPTIKNTQNITKGIQITKYALFLALFIIIGIPIIMTILFVVYKLVKWLWQKYIGPYFGCYIKYAFSRLVSGTVAAGDLAICKEQAKALKNSSK